MTAMLIDLVGWLGAILLLAAYILVSTRRVQGHAVAYQVLNAVGSALLLVNAVFHQAYPSALINVVFIAVAVIVLARRPSS